MVVFYEDSFHTLACDQHTTLADVRAKWMQASGIRMPVSFFRGDQHLDHRITLAQALPDATARSLEITAIAKRRFRVQVYGFNDSEAFLEVAPVLSFSAVRSRITSAIGINIVDFRLLKDAEKLNQGLPIHRLGLPKDALLTVDVKVIVEVHFDEGKKIVNCFVSDFIGDIRQKLNCGEETALVSISPRRHVLHDSQRVCQIVDGLWQLEMRIRLDAEKKVLVSFEPIHMEHRRQQLPVALSWTPSAIFNLVKDRFGLKTDFRLAIKGKPLDNSEPMLNQMTSVDVVEIDIIRTCLVKNLWEEMTSLQELHVFSTEKISALYISDELTNQTVLHAHLNLVLLGSIVDALGPISGQQLSPVLVRRDIQRQWPNLTFDRTMRTLAWARDLLQDVTIPPGGRHSKEMMHSGSLLPSRSTLGKLCLPVDSLTITDPKKIFVEHKKKLDMCRFPHCATYDDLRMRLQPNKSFQIRLRTKDSDVSDEAMKQRIAREVLYITGPNRFQTKMSVCVNGEDFRCWFEKDRVSLTDVFVECGKKAEVVPRHWFSKTLFCCGCKRQLSLEEEEHQRIPNNCCRVKSLKLTDRRTRSKPLEVFFFSSAHSLSPSVVLQVSECKPADPESAMRRRAPSCPIQEVSWFAWSIGELSY